jgi:protein ImuA
MFHPAFAKRRDGAALARLGARGQRNGAWRPGLFAPRHSEIFAISDGASGAGLALALARDALQVAQHRAGREPVAEREELRMVLWVQDRTSIRLTGRPCLHGLPQDLCHRLIHVEARTPEDALFALEEGLRCRDFAFVLGEITGNPRALSFTASRRLSLTAERHGVPLWLVRVDAVEDLSSARMRWKAGPAASPPGRWNATAPGTPSWLAELFRARGYPSGEWILRNDQGKLVADRPFAADRARRAPDHGDLARTAGGRSLAAV